MSFILFVINWVPKDSLYSVLIGAINIWGPDGEVRCLLGADWCADYILLDIFFMKFFFSFE